MGSDRNDVRMEPESVAVGECGFPLQPIHCVDDIPLAALPKFLGFLERLRAEAWVRMVSAPRAGSDATSQERIAALMTVSEVAALLRFSRGHLYELVRSGELPVVRCGRAVRLRREDVEAWQIRHRGGGVDFDKPGPASSTAASPGKASTSATQASSKRCLARGLS